MDLSELERAYWDARERRAAISARHAVEYDASNRECADLARRVGEARSARDAHAAHDAAFAA